MASISNHYVTRMRIKHFLFLPFFLAGLGIMAWLATGLVNADNSVTVQSQYPANNAYINGTVHIQSIVNGLKPDSYEMFWAVDNGTWNHMEQSSSNTTATATIDVSSWKWSADNTYKLQFIALKKSNWQPVEQDITVHIGTALTALTSTTTTNTTTMSMASTATPTATTLQGVTTSLNGKKLYLDPTNDASKAETSWGVTHASDAAAMRYLANQPVATWFGDWNSNVEADTKAYVDAASNVQAVPVLVAYNIPDRDCGSYSAGGVQNASQYAQWISQFAAGIGKRQAIVIVEPDAIDDLSCLSASDQTARLAMLKNAVLVLKQQTDASVYLDAGNPGWKSTSYMASKLVSAGINSADGFSLNVSNFYSTPANIKYGDSLSALVGNTHFVIDTSRNGSGEASSADWCNPAGRALGQAPTLEASDAADDELVDAYLWIKPPGASDGTCGPDEEGTSAPTAGTWWPQYAREMLLNSDIL